MTDHRQLREIKRVKMSDFALTKPQDKKFTNVINFKKIVYFLIEAVTGDKPQFINFQEKTRKEKLNKNIQG